MSSSTNVTVWLARGILSTALIAMIAVVFGVGLRFEHAGGRLLTVQTASMVPTFRPGDVLTVWPVVPGALQVGDIVTYRSPRDGHTLISHRLIVRKGSELITQGDALTAPDQPITAAAVVGRVGARAPGLGYVIRWLRSVPGLVVMLYMPGALIIVDQLRRLMRSYRPAYQLYGR